MKGQHKKHRELVHNSTDTVRRMHKINVITFYKFNTKS